MTVAVSRPATSNEGRTERRFRRDIDGLRAVAILLVVAYHAGIPGPGFIGVDVFFVISGFLITSMLVEELDATGRIRLGRFWSRRALRLVPAAALVVVAVLVVGQLAWSPLNWKRLAEEALSAATYWSNILFGLGATDYFGPDAETSPLLHTWSLAVEEQFYIVWPLLLIGAHRLSKVTSGSSRRTRTMCILAVTSVSFVVSLNLTRSGSPWAFFSPLARAWELGAGALVALAAGHWMGLSRSVRTALGVAGAGLLTYGLVYIGGDTPFPGTAALLPVLATVAILVAGAGAEPSCAGPVNNALAWHPLQGIGRLSYSWYLWHWPVIVLGMALMGRDEISVTVTLAAISLVPAWATHRLIENPLRYKPSLRQSPGRALVVMGVVVAIAVSAGQLTTVRASEALSDPLLTLLAEAREDWPPLRGACATADPISLVANCVYGDPDATRTVIVVGDSHAAHWIPAVAGAAEDLGARVIASTQGSCPSLPIGFNNERPTCTRRRANVIPMVDQLDADLVVISHSIGYIGGLVDATGHRIPRQAQLAAWSTALAEFSAELRRLGIPLVVILDVPRFLQDPIECVASKGSADGCELDSAMAALAQGGFHRAETDAIARTGFGTAIDPLPILCNSRTCPIIEDGAVMWTDAHHLTASFSASLADELRPFLAAALGP